MRTIREHVFETNSSSCHSLTVSDKPLPSDLKLPKTLLMAGTKWYDANPDLVSPEEKADYVAVCLAEYLEWELDIRTVKLYREFVPSEKWEEFERAVDGFSCGTCKVDDVDVPLMYRATDSLHPPRKIVDTVNEHFETIKKNIETTFAKHGVQVKWSDKDNRGIGITFDSVIVQGSIDDRSSPRNCYQPTKAIFEMLNEDEPERLFNFIFNPESIIHCDSDS